MQTASRDHSLTYNLACEWRKEPIGVDPASVRLSWQLRGETEQTDLRLFTDAQKPEESLFYTESLIQNNCIFYCLPKGLLDGDCVYFWQLRAGKNARWSETASFMTGPASVADWKACEWISDGLEADETHAPLPSPLLRGVFKLKNKPFSAILHASGLGLYRAYCNGERVGNREFAPEWTNYRKTVYYQSYDLTELLNAGDNCLAIRLADGWFAGRIGLGAFFEPDNGRNRHLYGERPAFIGRLIVEYVGGECELIATGEHWRVLSDGPLRFSDMVNGETVDLTREPSGWMQADFDDTAWQAARKTPFPKERLSGSVHQPVKVGPVLSPQSVKPLEDGTLQIDLGQNIAGWLRLRVKGRPGQQICIRHAEVLDPETGRLYRENLRISPHHDFGARQEYKATLAADGETFLEPAFTYFGFRYAEITGLSSQEDLLELEGCGVFTDAPSAYSFETSNPLLNGLMKAIEWTARDNMPSVPTDCPQRDERLGWAGDAQVFSQMACFLMDMAGFYRKWLRDLRDTQLPDGRFTDIAPFPYELLKEPVLVGNPGWADVGVLLPWTAYVNYGDERFLSDALEPAGRYLDFIAENNPQWIWKNRTSATEFEYGDWLNGDTLYGVEGYPNTGNATPIFLYATAFWALTTRTYSKMARALGEDRLAQDHEKRLKRITEAFRTAYMTDKGRVLGDNQAVYAFTLAFDLLPEELRLGAFERMAKSLDLAGNRLTTGIQSTIRLMNTLSRFGRSDLAYALLVRTDVPSWGYMLEQGGTTIWERWDGYVEGRGFQAAAMNSFNHYAIGAVGEWMFRNLLGINPDENAPGWSHCYLRPAIGGVLTEVRGEHRCIRGSIRTEWKLEEGRVRYFGELPPGCKATLELPVALAPHGIESPDAEQSTGDAGVTWAVAIPSGPFECSWHIPEAEAEADVS